MLTPIVSSYKNSGNEYSLTTDCTAYSYNAEVLTVVSLFYVQLRRDARLFLGSENNFISLLGQRFFPTRFINDTVSPLSVGEHGAR